ncbi:hypothetical protein HPB51_006407 [Rhipicephalus microplus]|uniref:Uncharacterized protein n=1 Tax=Rhipicephalus microplus TaxID=6941 RepID=A0A9J6EY88_RHIMP|nr:hypothetical protein HPB51_006407 [Rhipicephalus microplus]
MAQIPRCLINGNVVVNIGCVLTRNSPSASSGDGFEGSDHGPPTGLTQGESTRPKTNGNVGGISRRNGPFQRGTSPAMPADVPVQPASSVSTQRCTSCGRGTTSNRNSETGTKNADEVKDTFLDILFEELKKITLEDSIISNVMDVAHSVLTGLNFAGYSNSLIGSRNLTVPFSGACTPEAPTDGLSAGSVLLILFFIALLVYLVGGILINHNNGARGWEMVPHHQFWSELPGLCVVCFSLVEDSICMACLPQSDGCVFFVKYITCQGGPVNYGLTGGGGGPRSYDNI